jgi:hypothetical protein
MNRLYPALAAYAVIAVLAWNTLTGEKIRFFAGAMQVSPRDFVVTLMVAFAVLSIFHQWKDRARAKLDKDRDED